MPTWADEEQNLVNVIIEIPKNSMVKYEFNKDLNVVEVDRFFTAPMPMPYNYGLLPQTFNVEDNDPLDVILPSHYALHPGVITKAKVIWVLHMIDSGESDDKIIAIPYKEPYLWKIENIEQLNDMFKKQVEFFLSTYKNIDWKQTQVTGWDGPEVAKQIINKCIQDYKNR